MPPRTFRLESIKPSARRCMVWFPSREALIPERGEGKKRAGGGICAKKKERCCDKPKGGGKVLLHVVGLFFFPLTIWTLQLALAKDARRPVCTYERCSFVIPTLPHFQNLLCPVVFLSAGGTLSSVGGVPSEMETVFGLLLVPWSNLPPLPFPSVDCGLDLQ